MILTQGQYDIGTGYFFIKRYEVFEKPKTYKGNEHTFYKSEEEVVRYLKGSYSSYMEVYTTDTNNPIEKLQDLISNQLRKSAEMIPFKTKEDGNYRYNSDLVKKYMEVVDLKKTGIERNDLVTNENIKTAILKIEKNSLGKPRLYDLQKAVEEIIEKLQKNKVDEKKLQNMEEVKDKEITTCLNCGHENKGETYHDVLETHTECEECSASYDIEERE